MELTEARHVAIELVCPLPLEWAGFEEGLGRVLAEPVFADRDLPREARSRLDGYAVRSEDTQGASQRTPKSLELLPEVLAAGYEARVSLLRNQGVRILTGAPIPSNADAVVGFEEVMEQGKRILLRRATRIHEGMALPGEETGIGEFLVDRGQILTPTRLAMLAALGMQRLPVFMKPRVALLASGDEVRELGEPLDGPLTYCNNRYLLGWLTNLNGGISTQAGILPDDAGTIAWALSSIDSDVVITTGGVGRGQRDCILEAWRRAGIELCFRRINMIPGKNSALGVRGRQVFFALPGNPWGAQVVFEELVAPVLRRLQGLQVTSRPRIKACTLKSLTKKEGFFRAFRGVLRFDELRPSFEPVLRSRASFFFDLKGSFSYILLDPHEKDLPEGEEVDVYFHDCPMEAYPLLLGSVLC